MPKKVLYNIARFIAAAIMIQTLFFKFSGAAESVFIFSTLGAEPWGRFGSGGIELIASVLLFVPGYTRWGAAMGIVTMAGALLAHLFILGIEVDNDGGLLFILASTVLVSCLYVLWYTTKNSKI